MSGGIAAGLLTGRKVLLCHIRLLVQVICVQVYPANQNGIIPNMTSEIIVQTAEELIELGVTLGSLLRGGETIELIGDIGAGKTTLTKGLARGMGIAEEVQSPTFTLSRVYDAPNGRRLAHYDLICIANSITASLRCRARQCDRRVYCSNYRDGNYCGGSCSDTLSIALVVGGNRRRHDGGI